MTGANLIASGRVPTTIAIFISFFRRRSLGQFFGLILTVSASTLTTSSKGYVHNTLAAMSQSKEACLFGKGPEKSPIESLPERAGFEDAAQFGFFDLPGQAI